VGANHNHRDKFPQQCWYSRTQVTVWSPKCKLNLLAWLSFPNQFQCFQKCYWGIRFDWKITVTTAM